MNPELNYGDTVVFVGSKVPGISAPPAVIYKVVNFDLTKDTVFCENPPTGAKVECNLHTLRKLDACGKIIPLVGDYVSYSRTLEEPVKSGEVTQIYREGCVKVRTDNGQDEVFGLVQVFFRGLSNKFFEYDKYEGLLLMFDEWRMPLVSTEQLAIGSNGGMKKDVGKTRWELMPYDALEEVMTVIHEGAKKYKPYNWTKVEKYRYIGAIMRHFTKYMNGEIDDPDFNVHHMAHIATNCLFIIWQDRNLPDPGVGNLKDVLEN